MKFISNLFFFFFLKRVSELGHQVIGIESNEKACEQFFTENNINFIKQEADGGFTLFIVTQCAF